MEMIGQHDDNGIDFIAGNEFPIVRELQRDPEHFRGGLQQLIVDIADGPKFNEGMPSELPPQWTKKAP